MARSDLLFNLVRGSAQGDSKLVKQTVEAIVAEEHTKKHHLLAEKLWTVYVNGISKSAKNSSRSLFEDSSNREVGRDTPHLTDEISTLLYKINPETGFKSLVLDSFVLKNCSELVEEQLNSDRLRSFAVEPRNKILLAGAPGNGKTSLAHAIAYECGLPLYVVRYEALISSFLGETSNKLKKIFEFISESPCVIFFDEFDTLGKERGDAHETGEIKRVVSSLLLQIDSLPTYNIVIAATNHDELIDRAAWRRFQIRLELTAPNEKQIGLMLENFEITMKTKFKISKSDLLVQLNGLSYADIEQFLLDIKRRWILKDSTETLEEIIFSRLRYLSNRISAVKNTYNNESISIASIAESEANKARAR